MQKVWDTMSWLCSPFRTGSDTSLSREAYPKGKALANAAPNYAPDSNGLGKLAYYCEMNPTQLSKVAGNLLKSARADAKSAPTNAKAKARLCITLSILKRLIVDCRGNLSFFAREAVEIIELSVGVRELGGPSSGSGGGRRNIDIAERAASAFHAFATYAEQTSVGIDTHITSRYLSILAQFGSLAKEPYSNDSSVPGSRLVGLHAIDGAVSSDILFTANFEEQARHILPALIFNVLPNKNVTVEELRKLSREDTGNKEFEHSIQKKRPINERKARSIRSGKGDEKDVSVHDVTASAVRVLRTLFASGHSAQVSDSVEAVVAFLGSRDGGAYWQNVEWCSWLADGMALWTHLQYRFVVLGSLLDALALRIDEPQVSTQQTTLVAMITYVLTSKTSLVGLGIGDVLSQLLGLITKRARVSSQDALLPPLASAVAALGAHTYYADQVNDMAQDIINNIQSLQGREAGEGDVNGTRTAVRVHVQSLYLLLQTAAQATRQVTTAVTDKPESAEEASSPVVRVAHQGKRAPVSPTTFQESLFLMVDGDAAIRANYLHALVLFVKHELAHETSEGLSREAVLRFYHALHAYAYELLTSHSLGFGDSLPGTRAGSTVPSRKASVHSVDRGGRNEASPADFALIRDVLVLVHGKTHSSEAAIAGLPMLFTLEREAPTVWADDAARRQATFEVTRAALAASGATWGGKVAEPTDSSLLPAKVSHDLSTNQNYAFANVSGSAKSPRASATPDVFAGSSSLQAVSGLSHAELQSGLSGVWSAESALSRSGRNNTPYAQGTLRVISTTSVAALNAQGGSPGALSLKAPSVADLKATLGDTGSPTSPRNGAPSIKSHAVSEAYTEYTTGASPSLQRRRSSRIPKHEALALLDKATPPSSPVRSNRLSVVAPPYQ